MTIFGAVIIGDELLSGKRQDKHLARLIGALTSRGLELAWAEYLGDDPARIAATLRRTFASGDVVFSFGGIGATPDDYTRQSAAAALDVPLARHPEGVKELEARFGAAELNERRLAMVEFPQGAALIPNPYNRIPGFAVRGHYFVPGFPEMAWPMVDWVLETHYKHLFHQHVTAEEIIFIEGAGESDLIPMMNQIVHDFPQTKLSSLPKFEPTAKNGRLIEFSLRGDPVAVGRAMAFARQTIVSLGYPLRPS